VSEKSVSLARQGQGRAGQEEIPAWLRLGQERVVPTQGDASVLFPQPRRMSCVYRSDLDTGATP
jgi:hypothetical protein